MKRLLAAWGALFLLAGPAMAAERWVTLGAGVTETVFALGAGDRVVAVDDSSLHPAATAAIPKVGAHRQVSAEALLAVQPTLVVASEEIGPEAAFTQLASAGVRVVRVPAVVDLDGARARVRQLAALVGAKPRGEALIAATDAALAAIPTLPSRPKVAFVYARGAGTLLLAGRGTSVEALVAASGGTLAAPWEGFRPITAEAVVAAAPEVLLLTTRGLDSVGGIDGLMAIPGVAATPAGRARRVVAIDDLLLLTLGPRTPEAALLLHRALADVPAGSTP